jgi:small ligand-binding sensory domain FIST
MRFGVGLSVESDTRAAAAEAVAAAAGQMAAGAARPPVDLAMVFVSPHHSDALPGVLEAVASAASPRHLLGATAESVIGAGREVEDEPAIAVWLASLPGIRLTTFALEFERTPEGPAFLGLPDLGLDGSPPKPGESAVLLLGDPFTFPVDPLLERFNEDYPGVPVIGGMASAASRPGENRLFLDGRELESGAVGVLLDGKLSLRTVVSQGCRPIGKPLVITKCEANILFGLGGRPAWDRLREVLEELPDEDKALLRRPGSVMVGRAINEYRETFGRGDFLIRNLMGFDPQVNAVAVNDAFRVGQTIQFHLRDAAAADEDLRELVASAVEASVAEGRRPAGGLLFSCNGRGRRMFPGADHDVSAVLSKAGGIPVAGFFAAGELGPVGGKNFIHGFTASLALFEE